MYLANLETQNFSFFTFADTEAEAIEQLRRVWLEHRLNTGATYRWEDLRESVWCEFFRQGDTFINEGLSHSYNSPAPYLPLNECEGCGQVIECPNHGGAFDCTPFCELCEGNQEFTPELEAN